MNVTRRRKTMSLHKFSNRDQIIKIMTVLQLLFRNTHFLIILSRVFRIDFFEMFSMRAGKHGNSWDLRTSGKSDRRVRAKHMRYNGNTAHLRARGSW